MGGIGFENIVAYRAQCVQDARSMKKTESEAKNATAQAVASPDLLACPCGEVPTSLGIMPGESCTYAYTMGNCCGQWFVEFRTDYHTPDKPECINLAVEAWNEANRANSRSEP